MENQNEQNQNTEQPQPPVQPDHNFESKKGLPKWKLLGGIFVILLLLGGAYFLGQKSTAKPTEKTPTTTTASPTSSPDETANWKTFTGKYFSVKHPEGWDINDQSYQSGTDKYIGLAIQGPLRNDIAEAKEKNAYYIMVLKWDPISKALVPNTAYGSSGEQFIFQKEPDDQAVNEVPVGSDFIKNSTEHNTANQILSTFKFTDQTFQAASPTNSPTQTPQASGANVEGIKYTLPSGWTSSIKNNQLLLAPTSNNGGGFLTIDVLDWSGTTGRKEYFCSISKCDSSSYFTATQIGNLSGYVTNAFFNNDGGQGPRYYFTAKGNKFYLIERYLPASPSDFENNYQNVLNSLVF